MKQFIKHLCLLLLLVFSTILINSQANATPKKKPATKTQSPKKSSANKPATSPTPKLSPTPTASSQTPTPTQTPATETKPGAASQLKLLDNPDFKNEPTYINSDSLTLNAVDRVFRYIGHVEVIHGEMKLTADKLEGRYTDQNQIETLVAIKNVVITKGLLMKATSDRALYNAIEETVILTESPQIEQNGSILTADSIKIYLKENRSEAQGEVRVKMINLKGGDLKAGKL